MLPISLGSYRQRDTVNSVSVFFKNKNYREITTKHISWQLTLTFCIKVKHITGVTLGVLGALPYISASKAAKLYPVDEEILLKIHFLCKIKILKNT